MKTNANCTREQIAYHNNVMNDCLAPSDAAAAGWVYVQTGINVGWLASQRGLRTSGGESSRAKGWLSEFLKNQLVLYVPHDLSIKSKTSPSGESFTQITKSDCPKAEPCGMPLLRNIFKSN